MKENSLTNLIESVAKMEEVFRCNLGEWRFALEQAATLWQLCPFQVGDRVKLLYTPDISETVSWGWMCAKHLLVEGAVATVRCREFYDGQFYFGLAFDNETWIDHKGVVHPTSRESIFMFIGDVLLRVKSCA